MPDFFVTSERRPPPGILGRPNTRPPYACDNCTDHGWILVGVHSNGVWPVWGICPGCLNPNGEQCP
jgi:hypothetical protein